MLHTLDEDKMELFDIIDSWKPNIIHIDEMSERLNHEMVKKLYNPDRKYRIIETCHDIFFDPKSKIFIPDAYAFCTPYHLDTFSNNKGYKEVIEFPIDKKTVTSIMKQNARNYLKMKPHEKQVINVGLWTPGKNQLEGIEIARNHPKAMFHFIGNQAENFKEYWKPLMKTLPTNVKVWGERDDVHLFMQAADVFMFNSVNECNPIVLKEAISYSLPIIAKNLPQYKGIYNPYISQNADINSPTLNMLMQYPIPKDNTSQHFALNHLNLYMKTLDFPNLKQENDYKIISHFVNGPFVEIIGTSDSNFRVEFWDQDKNLQVHYDTVKVNHWVRANKEYFINWSLVVYKDDELVYRNNLNFLNERIYISFDSASLGDTIAWIPYVEEFRKKHNCKVIVSTFKNELFKSVYPNIEFVLPGTTVENIYGMYTIGWFYNNNKEPILPNTIPLQATATNILGLEYKEIKPLIDYTKSAIEGKYVTIATNSTAGCKLWPKENWQTIINYLIELGYNVINVSSERESFDNCTTLLDTSLKNTIKTIDESKLFIGLSSGLSWLAWALNKEVIMISNFTNEEHEFKCHRPVVKSVCNSCWNNQNFKFNKGDWNWCPIHKGTDRQFECQKAITPEMIIKEIENLINFPSSF